MKKKVQSSLSIVEDKSTELTSIENIKTTMEANAPEWVKEMNTKEDMANAVYGTSTELLVAIDDILIRYFKFSEENIHQFHAELKDILQGVKEFEDHGLTIMTPHSMDIIGEKIEKVGIGGLLQEIANTRLLKEKMSRAGLEYPVSLQATPFIKKLQEKNR